MLNGRPITSLPNKVEIKTLLFKIVPNDSSSWPLAILCVGLFVKCNYCVMIGSKHTIQEFVFVFYTTPQTATGCTAPHWRTCVGPRDPRRKAVVCNFSVGKMSPFFLVVVWNIGDKHLFYSVGEVEHLSAQCKRQQTQTSPLLASACVC